MGFDNIIIIISLLLGPSDGKMAAAWGAQLHYRLKCYMPCLMPYVSKAGLMYFARRQ